MKPRQSAPDRWLIVSSAVDAAQWRAIRRLPRRSGVLLLRTLPPNDLQRLRQLASLRQLSVVAEAPRTSARVHDVHELTRALLRHPQLMLISPLFSTRSHPDWSPLPLLRAATLARLAGRRAIALGGMDDCRFRRVQRLGFIAWAGISAFRT